MNTADRIIALQASLDQHWGKALELYGRTMPQDLHVLNGVVCGTNDCAALHWLADTQYAMPACWLINLALRELAVRHARMLDEEKA